MFWNTSYLYLGQLLGHGCGVWVMWELYINFCGSTFLYQRQENPLLGRIYRTILHLERFILHMMRTLPKMERTRTISCAIILIAALLTQLP